MGTYSQKLSKTQTKSLEDIATRMGGKLPPQTTEAYQRLSDPEKLALVVEFYRREFGVPESSYPIAQGPIEKPTALGVTVPGENLKTGQIFSVGRPYEQTAATLAHELLHAKDYMKAAKDPATHKRMLEYPERHFIWSEKGKTEEEGSILGEKMMMQLIDKLRSEAAQMENPLLERLTGSTDRAEAYKMMYPDTEK